MSYFNNLHKYFPSVWTDGEFVKTTYDVLNRSGFDADNTIACAGVCRDEITQPLVALIRGSWGESFNLSSLAGMFFAGRTGLKAAMHHAPMMGGREKYVFYSLPHVAIDSEGRVGVCRRRGREEDSTACGALAAFRDEMAGGRLNMAFDNEDVEQSLLKMRLLKEIPYGRVPDLLELTEISRKVTHSDIEQALRSAVDVRKSDYALISGIQIHCPDGDYVWCASFTAVINGVAQDLDLHAFAA